MSKTSIHKETKEPNEDLWLHVYTQIGLAANEQGIINQALATENIKKLFKNYKITKNGKRS